VVVAVVGSAPVCSWLEFVAAPWLLCNEDTAAEELVVIEDDAVEADHAGCGVGCFTAPALAAAAVDARVVDKDARRFRSLASMRGRSVGLPCFLSS
jgi:hypothetical protein